MEKKTKENENSNNKSNINNTSKKKTYITVAVCIVTICVLIFGAIKIVNYLNDKLVISNTDISKYNQYMTGPDAKKNFSDKWGMDESIWPDKITDNMTVKDYRMTFTSVGDNQYIGYLVVNYNKKDYGKEIKRLENYKSTKYEGYYGVKVFSNEYKLVAMYADKSQGFVYALTDNKDTVIYVELIFCNYFYDLNYTKYIPEKYLPIGFDATQNNAYRKKMLNE